jgi:hypothetical protein
MKKSQINNQISKNDIEMLMCNELNKSNIIYKQIPH